MKSVTIVLLVFLFCAISSNAQAISPTTAIIIMSSSNSSSSNNLTPRERAIIEEKRRKEAIEKAKQEQMSETFTAIDSCRKETGYTGKAYKAFTNNNDGSLVDMEKQAFAECMGKN